MAMPTDVATRRGSLAVAGGVIALTPIAAWFAVFHPTVIAAFILGAPVLALLVWSLSRPIGDAVIGYLFVYVFADTLKRLVIAVGPDACLAQYVPLGLKFSLLLVIGARGLCVRIAARRMDAADLALAAFVAFRVLGLVTADSLGAAATVLMAPFTIGPILVYFAFREADRIPGWRKRFLRTLTVLGVVAAGYGIFQTVHGPTWIDRAWAEASHDYSIQALNVWNAVNSGDAMRSYAFFADHFSYGFFLVASLCALAAGPWPAGRAARIGTASLLLVALGLAMTRSAWFTIVLVTGAAAVLTVAGGLKRLLPAAALLGYVALTLAINPIYERWFPRQSFGSETEALAFSLGTLEARADGAEAFWTAVRRYPLVGDAGEAAGAYFITAKVSGDLEAELENRAFDDSHNFLVGAVSRSGLPGQSAFLVFLVAVLRHGVNTGRREVWIVSGALGLFLTGVVASENFLNGFFFAWCAFTLPREAASSARQPVRGLTLDPVGGGHGRTTW